MRVYCVRGLSVVFADVRTRDIVGENLHAKHYDSPVAPKS